MVKEKVQVIIFSALFFALSTCAWLKPADEISDSELRKLAQLPQMKAETVLSGSFMKDFESYTLDQFPFRDTFRTGKAITSQYVLRKLDNNGIYVEDGYAAKMEYPLQTEALSYAADVFQDIYDKLISGTDAACYLGIIPDKNYFLADSHGSLKMDYEQLTEQLQQEVPFAQYIDLLEVLEREDYYRTDTHWNQVCITQAAQKLADGMGVEILQEYETVDVEQPFYGVYFGQAALPMQPDRMQYLTNEVISQAKVFDWQNNVEIPVYDESKMTTRSPYDLFLGGSLSMITIENDLAETDRELVVFRDSFGSSLLPLLISGYQKITIFDIRYLPHARLGSFITFEDQDVLFLYSTLVLNNSSSIK